MKKQFATTLIASLLSISAHANWYVDGISCLKPRNDGTQTSDAVSIHGTTIQKYLAQQKPGEDYPRQIPDSGDYTARYETSQRINPRTVWTGLFNWTTVYDGLLFEAGQAGSIQGVMKESRAEIHFKPFTDLAYGPDYATVDIYTKNPGDAAWTLQNAFPDCWVSVSH